MRLSCEALTSIREFAGSVRHNSTNVASGATPRFCYGLGLSQGRQIQYATEEAADYDFVASWVDDDTQYFTPVQLKELVPPDLNPDATLDGLLAKVSRSAPTDTVLAIKLSQPGRFDLRQLAIPPMRWKQLWFFWASSPDTNRWCLFGDALDQLDYFPFEYPWAA